MFKKILVPIDGSRYSREALKTAVKYARHFGAEIETLHVVFEPLVMYDFNLYHVTDEELKEAGQRTMELASKGLDLENVTINSRVACGYPALEIINAINDNVDLVIMGSLGRNPVVGALLGSVTMRVLAGTNCPVLVVK